MFYSYIKYGTIMIINGVTMNVSSLLGYMRYFHEWIRI